MRREMIIGCVLGTLAGGVVDLLLETSGAGLIGGAVLGGIVGYFLIPSRERAMISGGGDSGGGGYYGDAGAGSSTSDCGDSSDGGGCDGGGGD